MTQNSEIFPAFKTEISIGNQTFVTSSTPSHFSMAVYVPSLDRHGNPYKYNFWKKYFQSLFKMLFTGCETSKVEGSYRNSNGYIIEEVTSIISSELYNAKPMYTSSQIVSIVKDHMAMFSACGNQELVKYKINDKSYLLETRLKDK